MSGFDHLRNTYFEECAELLDAAYTHLTALARGVGDDDTVHAVFRAFHSIKGGGGAFGFDRLVAFAHELETLLDRLRDSRLALTPAIAALLLRSTDVLSDIVGAARGGDELAADVETALMAELREAAGGASGAAVLAITSAAATAEASAVPGLAQYLVRFVPRASLFRSANEPLLMIRHLARLGHLRTAADFSRLPPLAELDPEDAYLVWEFILTTDHPREDIAETFEFVGDDCELTIERLERAAEPGAEPVTASQSDAPLPQKQNLSNAGPSIRVDVEKVDKLVNLVGELVITQAMLAQLSGNLPPEICAGLLNGLDTMAQHLRELQEGVMAIRAQPIKSVFSRMSRLVREVSGQLGKEVSLQLSGEATEIDKTVIEQLADPLTHLLRNALDHGIEKPAEREAAGKPRSGTVLLSAEHCGGRIVIEITDDGRGIAREKVLAKAQALGLVARDAVMTDEDIDHLIFLPGFSTADTLSDISGRGVGMDVVKRNIQALGGRITVESRPGIGARFQLSLPLTLAILDGMAVSVGAETYILPLTNIMESLRPRPAVIHQVTGIGDVLFIRGEYVPLIYLCQRFSVPAAVTDPCQGIVVIVESDGANRIGLVVDDLLGQQQVVVKSLEANYGPVTGIGGATVLGDGRVALILDVSQLAKNLPLRASAKIAPPPHAGHELH
jgi:two-component system chemotaxis sensor kinase CheA